MASSALFIATLLMLAGCSLWLVRGLQRELKATGDNIHRCAVHQRELLLVVENHRLLQEVQSTAETIINESTTTVRSIHKEIASIPFSILESIPETRDTTRIVRGVHDVTSDSIYAGISLANRFLGKKLRKGMRVNDMIDEAFPQKSAASQPGEKKPAGEDN